MLDKGVSFLLSNELGAWTGGAGGGV